MHCSSSVRRNIDAISTSAGNIKIENEKSIIYRQGRNADKRSAANVSVRFV